MLQIKSSTMSRPAFSRRTVTVQAASWTKATTTDAIKAAGGKLVVEVAGQKVLFAEVDGAVYAVSNKCSHLGLPLVGKTALFQGKVTNGCVVCPAHNTAFDLKTGEVKGEWCPKFPNLPLVGKIGDSKPLPTFQSRVTGSDVEVFA
ncbi:hypothetical protein CEUSTIGMA_g13588.t1 [Chlamydomonas eustigma]|uniref:Rieske domain-containing protein n=1 Tax=Chlamydomonas eustigma TaxID=1157962 RepID=A0A250XSY8_9CHLO|nr:hypothetical protein CEUSTIGMA_g9434.t1 [Chlamydomonas eustigma]GAX86175.1 hypothetical protein CEUSTIGMA_g13588.t1 [Chlamydomonas eustigma]|eukprot:GAX82006.1 hypothetical protein CEUSTIGMA_g9434.t1 [Chlamydomonas eustigma]